MLAKDSQYFYIFDQGFLTRIETFKKSFKTFENLSVRNETLSTCLELVIKLLRDS